MMVGSSIAWLPFLAASLVLAATPGPGVIFIMTQTLSHGRAAGLWSLAGVALGNLGNAAAASLGLAALLAASSAAFEWLKWLGAAYLVLLGVQALRRPPAPGGGAGETALAKPAPARTLRDATLVALFNPKTTLFFAAFLPQFVAHEAAAAAPAMLQVLALGAVFVLIAACTDAFYVLLAARLIHRIKSRSTRVAGLGRILSALVYFGLGIYALMVRPPGGGARAG